MKESDFQKRIIDAVKGTLGFTFNVLGSGMQKAGMPDLWIASKEFHGWLELKVDNGKLTALQASRMRQLERGSRSHDDSLTDGMTGNRMYSVNGLRLKVVQRTYYLELLGYGWKDENEVVKAASWDGKNALHVLSWVSAMDYVPLY